MRFEIQQRRTLRGLRWFWRLRAANGEIVAQGEGYHNLADAEHAVDLVRSTGPATQLRIFAPIGRRKAVRP